MGNRGRLPIQIIGKAALEAAGIKFLGPIVNPRFEEVELPHGWTRVTSGGDPTKSFLLDKDGRKRAVIDEVGHFVKALCRYSIIIGERLTVTGRDAYAMVIDGIDVKRTIFTTEFVPFTKEGEHLYDARLKADELARGWLDEHLPRWKDPSAYWN